MNQNIKEMILSDDVEDAYLAMSIMKKLKMDVFTEVLSVFYSMDTSRHKSVEILINYHKWREENEPELKGNDPFGL